jgi:hypothetical protein
VSPTKATEVLRKVPKYHEIKNGLHKLHPIVDTVAQLKEEAGSL